ncbi:Lsr2 family protein [Kocuria koreensis]|jgi:hypothetical protein|uniref:Lsr2 family protein n=1 Tax=Rothia koreensis TaxID=592378 RepID=A0A7M3SW79_9MICC|nr:Lsr2 family protein [Rothia koreensis]MUN56044.1 Lsr2 family protein [Rothia koreensis]
MARHVEVRLTDDLDGTEAAETVRFSLEGKNYEIDLSADNAAWLRSTLQPFIAVARRNTQRNAGKSGKRSPRRNPETAKIRRWARDNGYTVANHGSINAEVKDAYYAANPKN